MENGNDFLNKHCKLILKNGFVLYGIAREITHSYVLFETVQRSSIIGFTDVKELCLDPRYYGGQL